MLRLLRLVRAQAQFMDDDSTCQLVSCARSYRRLGDPPAAASSNMPVPWLLIPDP